MNDYYINVHYFGIVKIDSYSKKFIKYKRILPIELKADSIVQLSIEMFISSYCKLTIESIIKYKLDLRKFISTRLDFIKGFMLYDNQLKTDSINDKVVVRFAKELVYFITLLKKMIKYEKNVLLSCAY